MYDSPSLEFHRTTSCDFGGKHSPDPNGGRHSARQFVEAVLEEEAGYSRGQVKAVAGRLFGPVKHLVQGSRENLLRVFEKEGDVIYDALESHRNASYNLVNSKRLRNHSMPRN